jgi:hypothetical protein
MISTKSLQGILATKNVVPGTVNKPHGAPTKIINNLIGTTHQSASGKLGSLGYWSAISPGWSWRRLFVFTR